VPFPKKSYGEILDFPPFRGRINPEFKHPAFVAKLGRFPHFFQETSHRILFDERNRISVVPFRLAEGKPIDIVAKEFTTRGLSRIKTLFLPSKAHKAWLGAVLLVERSIPTPVPVAYLEKCRSPFIDESCYFSVLEEGAEEIRYLFRRLSPEELGSLVQSLAGYLRLCHKKGILHRDLSDGNILVRKEGRGKQTFFLIDTNRIRLIKGMGLLRRIKNLTRLGVPDSFQKGFLEEYTGSQELKKGVWFWYRLAKKTYTLHIGLKKRLRLGKNAKIEAAD
jgi:serine/threonine protein kinase